ncbi:alkylated dna repair protein alkb-related [Holotrichia oblita]|uniref:Alkylated dna repair protein alkb-related n=1 Tax=Holotrichia oblita TaxID=644536 RepID=A0ACB9TAQ3_HOLOL|nr:alkylated dna repair protein alkb-related [Holotrichia oblita]
MFKQDFKYYKSRKPAPSFEDVLNLKHPNNYKVTPVSPKNTSKTFFGLKPIERWNVYEIVDRPGSIVRICGRYERQFPKDLSSLCSYLTKSLGFDNFNAEAAIVNYYHLDSTLSGHTDHSEQNLDAPLISGDVVIMSKAARLAYHGVPRIIQSNDSSWDISPEDCSGNFVNVEKDNLRICYDKTLWGPLNNI